MPIDLVVSNYGGAETFLRDQRFLVVLESVKSTTRSHSFVVHCRRLDRLKSNVTKSTNSSYTPKARQTT
jgi:hypothetical protein